MDDFKQQPEYNAQHGVNLTPPSGPAPHEQPHSPYVGEPAAQQPSPNIPSGAPVHPTFPDQPHILSQQPIPQDHHATAILHEASIAAIPANKSKRFLIAYLATIFSGMALLWSAVFLGGVLFNQFFGPKDDGLSFFDPAGIYISVMSAMVTFGVLYIVASRYVAKSAANDTIGLKDWRVYKLVYAVFAALLLLSSATVIASLLYIPIAQVSITDDLQPKQIVVSVLTSVHALIWIALLLWQERLVRRGKNSWLQGTVIGIAALAIIVLTAIFPIGMKTNDRYDARVADDLSTIEDKISTYETSHNYKLPSSLSDLSFGDDTVAHRLTKYTYTPHQGTSSDATSGASIFDDTYSTDDTSDYTTNDTSDYTSSYGSATYELCADFKTDTTDSSSSSLFGALTGSSSSTTSPYTVEFTNHKTGHVCFERE